MIGFLIKYNQCSNKRIIILTLKLKLILLLAFSVMVIAVATPSAKGFSFLKDSFTPVRDYIEQCSSSAGRATIVIIDIAAFKSSDQDLPDSIISAKNTSAILSNATMFNGEPFVVTIMDSSRNNRMLFALESCWVGTKAASVPQGMRPEIYTERLRDEQINVLKGVILQAVNNLEHVAPTGENVISLRLLSEGLSFFRKMHVAERVPKFIRFVYYGNPFIQNRKTVEPSIDIMKSLERLVDPQGGLDRAVPVDLYVFGVNRLLPARNSGVFKSKWKNALARLGVSLITYIPKLSSNRLALVNQGEKTHNLRGVVSYRGLFSRYEDEDMEISAEFRIIMTPRNNHNFVGSDWLILSGEENHTFYIPISGHLDDSCANPLRCQYTGKIGDIDIALTKNKQNKLKKGAVVKMSLLEDRIFGVIIDESNSNLPLFRLIALQDQNIH